MEWTRDQFRLTDDKSRLDMDVIVALLQSTYWAAERSRDQIEISLAHSLCFGMFETDRQIGFARAVTDHATFTWICDVVIAQEHRGRGLGKWLIECMLQHPALQTTMHVLRTRDAHGLYQAFGFERTEYLRRSAMDWSKPP